MNQESFVEGRRSDWARLEQLLDALERKRLAGRKEIQELLRLYRRAACDLAEAQTHFPASSAAERLHLLVGRAYGAVYRQPEERIGLSRFVFHRLPQTFRNNLGYFAFALAIFACACITGAALVAMDEMWAELCLPYEAIESIRRGEFWTNLFGVIPSSFVSALIFYNNTVVCFTAFALGLSFGLGTLYVLLVNGLMLGSALSLCWKYNMLDQLGAFMVGHGVLEISAILMAAAAGLMLGDALARPGRLRRLDSLRLRAREATALAVGALPFLAAAGLIEGYVSLGSLMHPLKYALGIGMGSLMYVHLFLAGRRTKQNPQGAAPTGALETWRPDTYGWPPARASWQASEESSPGAV